MTLKLAIVGAKGRMGQRLMALADRSDDLEVVAQIDADGPELSPSLTLDGVIDFSHPEQAPKTAAYCAQRGVVLVLGTTGLSDSQLEAVQKAAQSVAVVMAPNFSVGVNLLFALVGQAARMLGEGFDLEVVEAHHRRKVDAPSGTAIRLGEVLAASRGATYDEVIVCGREGDVGARSPGEIGMSVVRGGDVVGEHTVLYLGDGEQVSIGHRATDRDVFVRGALRAVRWAAARSKGGLYDMGDVLRG
jgi:4-hydroxy-tetrahydrodipicolinate reductase